LILEPTNELLLDIFYTVFYFLPYYFCVVWRAKLRKNMELPTNIAKKSYFLFHICYFLRTFAPRNV